MDLNKGNIKKILGIITFAVLLYIGLQKLDIAITFVLSILSLIFPFLLGAAIAFILNVPMRGIERLLFSRKIGAGSVKQKVASIRQRLLGNKLMAKIFSKQKIQNHKHNTTNKRRPSVTQKQFIKKPVTMEPVQDIVAKRSLSDKLRRPISLLITIILVIGVIMLVSYLVFPEIGRTFELVQTQFPAFGRRMIEKSNDLIEQYPEIAQYINDYDFDWEQIAGKVYDFIRLSGGNMLKSSFSIAQTILGGVIDFFVGFIFAIYILMQKEKLEKQSKKLVYAYIPEHIADKIIRICSLSSKTFSKFLSGQCIEAVILGTIFFIAMSIFRFPYALMISVLIAFTALIPVFGAFIGCFIGAFLILIVNPIMALWFIIMFIILQQLENNLIYPQVVGGSIGLPSMWVLVAVTIGGSIMGVAGMLIFIPMTSVIYTLLREAINDRIQIKNIPEEKYKE